MKINRRVVLVGAAMLALASSTAVHAAAPVPFDQAAYETAREAGKPILIHVTAPWCEVCQMQKPIVSELSGQANFSDMVFLEVDFDTQEDVRQTFGVSTQSTMIVFRGSEEVGRKVGETDPAAIEALLRLAL